MKLKIGLAGSLFILISMGILTLLSAQPAEPGQKMGSMMEKCKQMMEMQQKMQMKMKQEDARLQELVEQMEQASANEKLPIIEEILARMVQQRQAMHQRMAQMRESMMEHMGDHMRAGPESTMKCPMMQRRGPQAESHQENRPESR